MPTLRLTVLGLSAQEDDQEWGQQVKPAAQYHIVKVTPAYIAIVDDSQGGRSVTNDAEAIVLELQARHGLGSRLLIYRDSEGQWDVLRHDGAGRFLDFEFLGAMSLDEAVNRLRERKRLA